MSNKSINVTPKKNLEAEIIKHYDGKIEKELKELDDDYQTSIQGLTAQRSNADGQVTKIYGDLRTKNRVAGHNNASEIKEYTVNNGLKNSGYRAYLEETEQRRYNTANENINRAEKEKKEEIEEAFKAGVQSLKTQEAAGRLKVTETNEQLKQEAFDYYFGPEVLKVNDEQVEYANKHIVDEKTFNRNSTLVFGDSREVKGVKYNGVEYADGYDGYVAQRYRELYEDKKLNVGTLFHLLGGELTGYEDYLTNEMGYEDVLKIVKLSKSSKTIDRLNGDTERLLNDTNSIVEMYNQRFFDSENNPKVEYRGDSKEWAEQITEKVNGLLSSLATLKAQYNKYLLDYGENESITKVIEYIDNAMNGLLGIKNAANSDAAGMGVFKSEEEYLRYTVYNAIGKRLTYDNILAEIKRLGDLQKTQDPDKAAGTQKIRDDLNGLLYSADYKDNASFDKAIADLERQIVDLDKKSKAEKDSETKKIWDRKLKTAKDRKEILIKKYADWKKSGQMRAFGTIQDMPEFREFAEEGANAVLFDTNGSFFDIASSYEAESRKGTWYEGDDYSEKFQDQNFVAIFQKILEKIPSDQREKLLNGQITIYDVDTDGDGKADLGVNSCPHFDRFMSDIINDGRLMGVPHSDGDGERDKINVFIGEMTEQEMEIYNAYFAMSGLDAANKYLAYLVEGVPTVAEQYLPAGSTKPKNNGLNMRKAEREYEKIKDSKFKKVAFGIEAGLDSWENGFLEFLDGCDSEYVPITAKQYQAGLVTDSLGEGSFARVLFDVNTSIGNMLPSIITSTAVSMLLTPAGGFATLGTAAKAVKMAETAQKVVSGVGGLAGSALTGMASAGNAYQEAKRLGYDDDQAKNYALMTGAVEGGMQYLLSGISSLGGALTGNIISNAVSKINNGIARVAFKLGGKMAGESFEEYLQEVSGSVIKNLTLGTAHDLDLFSGDAFYAAFLGAITCGLLEGVDTVRSDHAESAARAATDALFDQARAMPEGSKAHKMATELYDGRYNLDKNQIQALVDEIGIESKNAGQRFYNATADALKRFGETGSIKNIATAATALMQGAQLTDAQMKFVADSKLNEMVAKVDTKTGEVTFEAVSGTETKPHVDLNTDGDSVVESFKNGVDGKAVGDGGQLNSVSGEAGSKDSAFSLPEVSGEPAVSGVDDAFYNNLTAGLRGEKDVGFNGEAEVLIGELSENVDENIDKNSENFEKDLENGQNGKYNKNKGSVDGALEGLELLNSYNMGLEGERHPVTNIYFKRMETVVNGVRYAVVMPCFDSKYKAALLPNQFLLSDKRQFRIADKQLKLAIESNPEVAKQFTEAELNQIKKGRRPSGYTWHHAAEPGSLELVNSELHNKTGHTGGRYFWGGGSKNR